MNAQPLEEQAKRYWYAAKFYRLSGPDRDIRSALKVLEHLSACGNPQIQNRADRLLEQIHEQQSSCPA